MSEIVTFLPATFLGVKNSLTRDITYFLLDSIQFYPYSDIEELSRIYRVTVATWDCEFAAITTFMPSVSWSYSACANSTIGILMP